MNSTGFTTKFHFQIPTRLEERKRLKAFIAKQLSLAGKTTAHLNFIFLSDESLLAINRQYLNHDFYTDIITFDLSEKGNSALISDIYISVERVRENAGTHKSSGKIELHRVIFHGILHLLGFKDKTTRDQQEMRKMEDRWLALYFQH